MKYITTLLLCFFYLTQIAQEKSARITGKVQSQNGTPLEYASVTIKNDPTKGVLTDSKGTYSITVSATDSVTLIFSSTGYSTHTKTIALHKKQAIQYNTILYIQAEAIPDVHITYDIEQEQNISYLSNHDLVGVSGISLTGVEGSIKTLPGVSSQSELSSQYSVRGGSYDENLIYINNIPTHKPIMASSDKQEGLSIINPHMVENIEFSSGGFGVEYGDKLSSVLSVSYKEVTEQKIQLDGSLMDANLSFQGTHDSIDASYLVGMRYKNTSLILNTLQEDGEYKPVFYDIQALLSYSPSEKTKFTYWLYGANNTFRFIPKNRITDFGNQQKTFRMKVYFEGNEKYQYQNIGNALSIKRTPTQYTFHTTNLIYYQAREYEKYDVLSQYRLDEIQMGEEVKENKDSVQALAIGSYLDHGRNKSQTNTVQITHDGTHFFDTFIFYWGGMFEHSRYDAQYNEWTYIDSANYSLPYAEDNINLSSVKNNSIPYRQNRFIGYLKCNKRFSWYMHRQNRLRVSAGLRTIYDDYTQEIAYNPRIRLLLKPESKKNIGISFSTGLYTQPPQFKELIGTSGTFYHQIQSQQAIHYVFGYSSTETIWERPFKLNIDLYYKDLLHSIPYTINNVNILYYPQLEAEGYITGIDAKLNGEFVKGVESWISLSIMKAREHLKHTDTWIRKPNDQLFNFSMFFQDYLPGSDNVKMNMTCILGSNIPTSAPNNKYEDFDAFSLSSYSRIDIGFLYVLLNNTNKNAHHLFKKVWIGAEIFNLMNIGNKISYFWIEDVNNNTYGVPNYLTSRRLNLKFSITI
ncbi:MAG: carboxypeptidase-like regulatory domain-containing protein [Bacteroidales bacterium]